MPRIPEDATIEDIDLDEEEVYLPDGRRLTEQVAEEEAASSLRYARRRGRPSISGGSTRSPQVSARVSVRTRDALRRKADAEGKRPSDVVREAIERYVDA